MSSKLPFVMSAYAAALLALGGTASSQPPAPGAAPPPPVVSPEIAASRDVTLRLRAPSAERVDLVSGGDIPGVPMQGGLPLAKGADGVFSLKLPALASGAYRYRFDVDGVATSDPSNPLTSESNSNAWSLFYVPGASFMDTQRVAHGSVAEVYYYSTVLNRARRMHVYTPPGYERNRDLYPVFYLLHGAFDGDDSWSTVGRAGFILDNLIAAGDARPMIVVMPDGHTSRFGGGGAAGLNMAEFEREFTRDIKPHVETNYRIRGGRASTAIAGLSMGGAQALDIAVGDLRSYAYVGVYSSGVFGIADNADWENSHRTQLDDKELKRGLELVWFSTGKDDFLLDTTKQTVAMLKRHDFDVVYEESLGGHTWINWREYLTKFAPKLFH
ncbi:MAG TPA: alpha/beta hydrolase-fold protein [Gammaproteobacteria bacterium]|nr:alpha/beta hydrolase-fold protein [Gammaproteobacteria bacterium]